jgi:hypothetical protein
MNSFVVAGLCGQGHVMAANHVHRLLSHHSRRR